MTMARLIYSAAFSFAAQRPPGVRIAWHSSDRAILRELCRPLVSLLPRPYLSTTRDPYSATALTDPQLYSVFSRKS